MKPNNKINGKSAQIAAVKIITTAHQRMSTQPTPNEQWLHERILKIENYCSILEKNQQRLEQQIASLALTYAITKPAAPNVFKTPTQLDTPMRDVNRGL